MHLCQLSRESEDFAHCLSTTRNDTTNRQGNYFFYSLSLITAVNCFFLSSTINFSMVMNAKNTQDFSWVNFLWLGVPKPKWVLASMSFPRPAQKIIGTGMVICVDNSSSLNVRSAMSSNYC